MDCIDIDISISCKKCGRELLIVDQEVSGNRIIIDFADCECEDDNE